MKLRDKKTGKIKSLSIYGITLNIRDKEDMPVYHSLKELNDEWEDYKDELFYVISSEHKSGYQCVLKEEYPEICKTAKELGIGFETEEEVKKAVEKLKAFTRLKDKGFKFSYYGRYDCDGNESPAIAFEYPDFDELFDNRQVVADLDICFGGEE